MSIRPKCMYVSMKLILIVILGQNLFRQWFVARLHAPNQYLSLCWLIRHQEAYLNEILFEIQKSSIKKIHLKCRLQSGGHFVRALMHYE